MGQVRQNPILRTVSLFICVCIALCTIVAHNIAQNRPNSFPPYPPDNHHYSDDVYLREGGRSPFGTEVDLSGGHIVLDGFPALRERGTAPSPLLGPCLLWPQSPISATAELLYYFWSPNLSMLLRNSSQNFASSTQHMVINDDNK